ncbi:asparagine synthase-related protein [Metabacillus sp. RGM 3146]|uniref:asparagine synthase-related protein n=1 Tax=Metabacillus sp. RGM 3146 TaxID=3401092 RepID=UPI003B99D104
MNKSNVILREDGKWYTKELDAGTLSFRGYVKHKGKIYTSENIEGLFASASLTKEFLEETIGEFAIILQKEDEVIAAVDRKRTIPLFYNKSQYGAWQITDHLPNSYLKKEQLHEASVIEFITTGYSANERTLSKDHFQIEAGQLVKAGGSELEKVRYFSYYHTPKSIDLKQAADELASVFKEIFHDLSIRLKDRSIIIPLSGGYDSRIIALLLKDAGFKKIKAFTYGKPNSAEAKKSEDIAKRLGIEWTIVPYQKLDWQKWYASSEWKEYEEYATNISSMAHIQDWPAVRDIIRKYPDEKHVFIPGHSGDFTAGSHIPYELTLEKEYKLDEIVREITKKHHRLWDVQNNQLWDLVKKEIKGSIAHLPYTTREEASSAFEFWDWKERQGKFIINSLRVYDYYNQDWDIPLWDDRLTAFFLNVPVRYRFKKYLYDYTLHQMYPHYFPEPKDPEGTVRSVQNKYGRLYPLLKRAYQQKEQLMRYHKDPMEWYGITGSYMSYLNSLSFTYDRAKFKNPYNINSILVKNYISQFKG